MQRTCLVCQADDRRPPCPLGLSSLHTLSISAVSFNCLCSFTLALSLSPPYYSVRVRYSQVPTNFTTRSEMGGASREGTRSLPVQLVLAIDTSKQAARPSRSRPQRKRRRNWTRMSWPTRTSRQPVCRTSQLGALELVC